MSTSMTSNGFSMPVIGRPRESCWPKPRARSRRRARPFSCCAQIRCTRSPAASQAIILGCTEISLLVAQKVNGPAVRYDGHSCACGSTGSAGYVTPRDPLLTHPTRTAYREQTNLRIGLYGVRDGMLLPVLGVTYSHSDSLPTNSHSSPAPSALSIPSPQGFGVVPWRNRSRMTLAVSGCHRALASRSPV